MLQSLFYNVTATSDIAYSIRRHLSGTYFNHLNLKLQQSFDTNFFISHTT